MAIPKLALIPSGVKAGKLYSVLPTNGDGDFTTTRNTVGTRVNENGLIEEVASNVPRLDYSDGGCPSLLLEPASTNLIVQSEDFSNAYWAKSSSSVVSGFTSPKGDLSAFKLTEDTSNGVHYIIVNTITGVSVNTFTSKVYAKKGERSWINLVLYDGATKQIDAYFDLENGVTGTSTNAISTNIKQLVNGWYECSMTYTLIASSAKFQPYIRLAKSNNVASYQGNGTSGVYIFGAQLEQNSYATSYIKTVGTTQTRSADTANGAGNASTFNDSEGVLMAEISALADDVSSERISISNGTSSNNRLVIEYDETFGLVKFWVTGSGTTNGEVQISGVKKTELNKISVLYKTNVLKIYINGFNVGNGNGIVVPTGLDNLKFEQAIGGNNFYGNTKQIQYFDSALNDSELEKLTSWTSFTAMANAQSYTII